MGLGVSPDEKIFTTTDERGFFPYTLHPTPYTLFPVSPDEKIFTTTDERGFFPYTPHPFRPRPSIYIGFAEKVGLGVSIQYSDAGFQFTVHSKILPTSPLPHFPIPFKQDLLLACISISDYVVKFG
ncbi:hypothetical protein O53_5061 [Microcystis aeruginosa TAIHU98]|uniref:Uncharacterized protein n=1 Tax=Microcystis aeruginosa TAIHU98 TaxID=1134457 RepID=L7DZY3_MICAE|nr:hypothetical protein O53_5061 [Microcystis aeruginosa TAIHU98]ODV36213.1 DNA gyrase subunit A [Microcystis aeruginosa NIES-98]